MKGSHIRILLADDHYVVRMGLRAIIEMEPDLRIVGEAEDGTQAIEQFRRHRPEVVLMDLKMPKLDGLQATVLLRKEFPDARILMLSTYDGHEDIHRALAAGAMGYVLKNSSGADLVQAIRAVRAGQRYIPPVVAQRLAQRPPCSDLSERELDVLRLVVKGLSNKELADQLRITEHTAKSHLKSILGKLNVRDRTEAATLAIHQGIVHLP